MRRVALVVTAVPLLVGALSLAQPSTALAWYCPPGTQEWPENSGTCLANQQEQSTQTTPEQGPPTAPVVTPAPTSTPAPAPATTPAPAPASAPAAANTLAPAAAPSPSSSQQQSPSPPAGSKRSHHTRSRARVKAAVHTEAARGTARARPVRTSGGASLPYTGFNVGLIGLLGAALLCGGWALRRRSVA